jgi:rhomboid protease GluP
MFFLFLQIVVFGLTELYGSSESTKTLVEFGAKFTPLILAGEWWRFITPIFLHIGFFHLMMNSFALYYIGSEVEKIYGSVRFLLIYLFAGFAGTLGSFLFTPSISAGASGAIFGCFGALLFFGIKKPRLFFRKMGSNIILLVLINLVLGFTISGIDHAGHIGGLAGGFLASAVVGVPKKSKPLYMLLGAILLSITSYYLVMLGYSMQTDKSHDTAISALANDYLQNGQSEKAADMIQSLVKEEDYAPTSYFLLGNIEIDNKNLTRAKEFYLKAIQQKESFHQAHYNVALVYLEEKNMEKAKYHAGRAHELKPSEPIYKKLKTQLDKLIVTGQEG